MDPTFQLKLLNGPLAGRTLQLPPGRLTLGPEDPADVLLSLDAGHSATLDIETQAVHLTSATPCWVAGRPQLPGPLPTGCFIDLAGQWLVLAAAGEPLATPAVVARARPLRWWWPWLAGISLLVAVASAFWPRTASAPVPDLRSWLPQALRAYPGLTLAWQPDGTARIAGRCTDSRQLAMLQARLGQSRVGYQWQAVCDDELRRSVLAVLQSYGYADAVVRIAADGLAQIEAQVLADQRFTRLTDDLDRLPGLGGWQILDRQSGTFERLLQSLRGATLLDGVSLQRDERGWTLSVARDATRLPALQTWVVDMQAQLPVGERLRLVPADPAARVRDYLPAEMAAIGGNPTAPFLVLQNGLRLSPGSALQKGMRLLAIFPDGLSLQGADRLLFLPLQR